MEGRGNTGRVVAGLTNRRTVPYMRQKSRGPARSRSPMIEGSVA